MIIFNQNKIQSQLTGPYGKWVGPAYYYIRLKKISPITIARKNLMVVCNSIFSIENCLQFSVFPNIIKVTKILISYNILDIFYKSRLIVDK